MSSRTNMSTPSNRSRRSKAIATPCSTPRSSKEFVAEQISGSVAATHLHRWAAGREAAIERGFLAESGGKANDSRWVYNQLGTQDWPGDLGYWVGYRVAKSYYERTPDKAAAIKAIIEMRDPAAFLAESGWTPGMKL